MKPFKEGDPRSLISPSCSPGREQSPPAFQRVGQTPPADLARQREIFYELMKGVPKAWAKIEPTLLGEPSPEALARKREIFYELMKGVPKAWAKIEPTILNARGHHQQDNQTRRRPDDARTPRTPYDTNIAQLRSFIQQERLARDPEIPPQAIIQERLSELGTTAVSGAYRARVWDRLASAWDALTHDSYQIGSPWERRAGYRLFRLYRSTQNPTIELPHDETLILGALAHAAGSPLERGIAVIEIPEHLRNYELWTVSPEYQTRLTNPDSTRNK